MKIRHGRSQARMRKEEGCARGRQPRDVKSIAATETNIREENVNGFWNETRQATGFMKDGSQTRKNADMQRVDFIKPNCKLKVGCWNVRTLYQAGKLAQLLREMENYNIDYTTLQV